ncbi:hypothetical protein HPB50_020195 [Hyalomma asiaticum]|uniref:Uncharacterized protein n=1 Tax=Hyalomma asiaticum TaxID=266040 RepID=A0ACB7TQH8_HYAAI|nr:hypothetical protein HPB50_020195 [Hyalomma asiaticum]
MIEILPKHSAGRRCYVLNVYSPPSREGLKHSFEGLFREATRVAGTQPLLIGGDFNAPHAQWGYGHATAKGRNLVNLIDDLNLVLLNEPASRTRMGAGVCRDTTPDLSISANARDVQWENTFKDLGSDHRIISVTIGNTPDVQGKQRMVKIIHWDKFRKNRDQKQQEPIQNIPEWNKDILADVEKAQWTSSRLTDKQAIQEKVRLTENPVKSRALTAVWHT